MTLNIENISTMINTCNIINNSDKGINTDDDNIPLKNNLKYYNITPQFILYNNKFNIKLVHFHLQNKGKTLIILPGFSEKSICWTIGRIFRFQEIIKNKGFSNIYIFDFKEIKSIQDNQHVKEFINSSATSYNCFYNEIALIVDKIIRNTILDKIDKISILGRSAGGGIALFLYQLNTCNYIEGLNLAAPGYDPDGLPKSFITKAQANNLNIRLSYSINDSRIPKNQIDNMHTKFKILGKNYKYIEITNIDSTLDGLNHRIHKELLNELI